MKLDLFLVDFFPMTMLAVVDRLRTSCFACGASLLILLIYGRLQTGTVCGSWIVELARYEGHEVLAMICEGKLQVWLRGYCSGELSFFGRMPRPADLPQRVDVTSGQDMVGLVRSR